MRLDELNEIELVTELVRFESQIIDPITDAIPMLANAVELASSRFRPGGRLIYFGAGSSGRLCISDAAECWTTFGVDRSRIVAKIAGGPEAIQQTIPGSEDSISSQLDVKELSLCERDTVVGVSASGRTRYVIEALKASKERESLVLAFTFDANSVLSGFADIEVNVPVGDELLFGSTRLKAATATKIMLATFSTALMIRSGLVFDRHMVAVQAVNEKLRNRAARIVSSVCEIDILESLKLLESTDYDVRQAILVRELNASPNQASTLLAEYNGNLRECLNSRNRIPSLSPKNLFLGVDAGGSNTVALIGGVSPDGEPLVIGRGESGAGNISSDVTGSIRAIQAAVDDARTNGNCGEGAFESVYVGAAGAGAESSRLIVERWARKNLSRRATINNDIAPILDSLPRNGPRIVFVCGTGTFAMGKSVEGKSYRSGGWGWRLHSGIGGYGLVVESLNRAVELVDAGTSPELFVAKLIDHFGVANLRGVVDEVNNMKFSVRSIAETAPLIIELAENGDPFSSSLVDQCASKCAKLVLKVDGKIAEETDRIELFLVGGLIAGSIYFRNLVLKSLPFIKRQNVQIVNEPAHYCLAQAVKVASG